MGETSVQKGADSVADTRITEKKHDMIDKPPHGGYKDFLGECRLLIIYCPSFKVFGLNPKGARLF